MDTTKLKKFAQFARRTLIAQVGARLDAVLDPASAARREHSKAVDDLEKAINAADRGAVIERVAYIWFNRFSALRYMDVNNINGVRVVSPLPGAFQPEILADAKAGIIDDRVPEKTAKTIRDLLDGRAPSPDPQAEAYRALLVAICNDWHTSMPFMFERIEDCTELLMPEDLLSNNSILAYTREAMTPDACEDVEIIGWLYQFYISEKKDEVFAGLKKNQKITAENIPAATQLFTPHWIVRYLVENSLGRLWLLNRPQSRLAERMDYYIAPEEPETDFLKITKPEDIRICDPAAGSGHMLTYAFDLLHAIYEEEGYDATEIPALILTHNLTGVEIDDRAGALAAFALAMKAAAKLGRRRFLRMEVNSGSGPDICVLQNVAFTKAEMQDVAAVVGKDLFTDELRETLVQFEQAKNFGSLIVPKLRDPAETLRVVEARDFSGDLLLKEVQERVVTVLRMAEYLSPKYHVVVANPPYMGGKGMNGRLKAWAGKNYPDSKSDLFAMFMERGLELIRKGGFSAMVTMESWMFLSSFEKLRTKLLGNTTIQSMTHMPYLGKGGTSMGINFGTTASVAEKMPKPEFQGQYCCVRYYETDEQGVPLEFPPQNERLSSASAEDFRKIPGSPIAYWVSDGLLDAFVRSTTLGKTAEVKHGLSTGKNEAVVRTWHEISRNEFGVGFSSREDALSSGLKWFPYNKGGDYRKWFGNCEYVLRYDDFGNRLMASFSGHRHDGKSHYFREGVTWTFISSSNFAARYTPNGFVFDVSGSSLFVENPKEVTGYLCSNLCYSILKALNPTLNFQVGNLKSLPILKDEIDGRHTEIETTTSKAIDISKSDWDAYETSWDFSTLPMLRPGTRQPTLAATYASLRARWQQMTDEMQRLEEENNRIFIDAYGLQDELTPDVPPEEITLTCNPAYRYGGKNTDEELESKLRADTLREFLSYAVGCMFGRYSLDAPGLILANQGETLADYLTRVPNPGFAPDEDNVIPILDSDWFPDDITERFRRFLSVTFGADTLQDNLATIEEALGKDIRKYFVKDFYADHVKRYKKRPIYWMFASPKGTFQALIYMHRYREDTVSVVLNDYLREFKLKLEGHRRAQEALSISTEASQSQRTKAIKEIERVTKQITELEAWERDVLFPLAHRKQAIDLDDGVKVNYPLFGSALKKIVGVS